jgi:hypothetical protein
LITNTCPIDFGPLGTVVVVAGDDAVVAGAAVVEGADCFEDDEQAPNTKAQLTIATRVLIGRA